MTRRKGLALPVIVSAAVEIADERGLDAVSMRNIAERLGVSAMGLYRHVRNRDVLVELMVDEVVGEFAYPEPRPERWRDALEALAKQDWRSYFAHPWVLAATATSRPPMRPNMLASMEWALAAFDGLGLAAHEQLYLLGVVTSYGQGLALGLLDDARARADGRAGTGDWWRNRFGDATGDAADRSGPYQRLASTIAEISDRKGDDGHIWEEFEFGLKCVLDGVESYLLRTGRIEA
ncbi:TetR/AcrR family transcriptional regulator [Saccharopolyspora indica]|uniref:TetR/AcrR family transcriptional regulator n=1 Tax=Saccharopolyspora indica TaxID=1229659 RepID=UPI0022EB89D0|nr:TetR/AcrR family transcriptional regulator [Saccharopolyspora indica]MDA3645753.1 TetR/AcrR family transcriptional regulator [Saccharopolyspora indica]